MTIRFLFRSARVSLWLALFSLPSPTASAAQAPGSSQDQGAPLPWPAPSVGIHFGYDQVVRGQLVGAQIHIPILPNAKLEVLASGNTTFAGGLREYQGNVDLVYSSGGRRGGLYGGGGLAFRNTVFGTDLTQPRETRQGYGIVVGLQSLGFLGPFLAQFEFRWVFLEGSIDPRIVSLGLNFPLWGRVSPDSGGFGRR